MDSSRRVFRGRGGPTDRRLPKYNARRRKAPREEMPEQTPVRTLPTDNTAAVVGCRQKIGNDELEELIEAVVVIHEEEAPSIVSVAAQHHSCHQSQEGPGPFLDSEDDTKMVKCRNEIRHLLQRVQHVRDSIALSTKAISDSNNYEKNVLNATANCVNEWRSIVAHYIDRDESFSKNAALQVFELIQHALQCGPLAGAKPGYFKRCGSSVAMMVLHFLDATVPEQDAASRSLCFTLKQADAINRWKLNARKAIERT